LVNRNWIRVVEALPRLATRERLLRHPEVISSAEKQAG
jgi:hypothetical protein